jgi:hypothetical protein
MSIKIYSGYDEFKCEETELCQYIEEEERYKSEDVDEEDSNELFLFSSSNSDFRDSSVFYIVADLEDEENAEDISGYLGKLKRIELPDFHKVLFCVN